MSLAAKTVVAHIKSKNSKGLACLCGYLFILGGSTALIGILSRKGILAVDIAEELVKSLCIFIGIGIYKSGLSSVMGVAAAVRIRQSISTYPQLGVMVIS